MIREIEESDALEEGKNDGTAIRANSGSSQQTAVQMSISKACEKYLNDARGRELSEPTIYKLSLLVRRLTTFAAHRNLLLVESLDVDIVRQFRETWPYRGTSANKRLEELRAFFNFCQQSKWISENPAKHLRPVKIDEPPREPFSEQEIERIRLVCAANCGGPHRQQLRVLVHLLTETGLRLGDAVSLNAKHVSDGNLDLWTKKTGTRVWMPLPSSLLTELKSIERSDGYFFWTGKGKLKSRIGNWQRTLKKMFREALIEGDVLTAFVILSPSDAFSSVCP